MSLLDEAMTECTMLNKISSDDGYGGEIINWIEGSHFNAAITFDTSIEARIAEQQNVSSLYTVTAKKDKVLEYHDVFRRELDGKIFRVTSDGDDKATPNSTKLNMRQVTAQEWSLPNG